MSHRDGWSGLPDYEIRTGGRIYRTVSHPRGWMVRCGAATAENLIAEIPGRTPEWVVLCAHYDGHDLAQSAMDNGTGVAVALEVARALAPLIPSCGGGCG